MLRSQRDAWTRTVIGSAEVAPCAIAEGHHLRLCRTNILHPSTTYTYTFTEDHGVASCKSNDIFNVISQHAHFESAKSRSLAINFSHTFWLKVGMRKVGWA